jgi:cytochrome P450
MYIDYANATNQPQMLKPKYLRDTILTLMSAGRDTVAVTLCNAFNQLDLNPECHELLEQEAWKLFPNNEGVTVERLKAATYADAVFNETLRFSPPATINIRFCNNDVVMPSGMKITKHSQCVIAINAIGRDPAMWGANADVFDPDRWFTVGGDDNMAHIPENRLPAFWAGPRACVGKDIARLEAKTVLLSLAKEFDIKVQRPLNETIILNSLAAFREDGLPVTVSLRGRGGGSTSTVPRSQPAMSL